MKKCFISYSRKDQYFAQALKTALEHEQFSVWLDLKNIAPGQYYLSEISNGIEDCDVFLLLTSKHSLGSKAEQISGSKEVERELEFAKQRGKTIIPIKLDDIWTETCALQGMKMNLVTSQWLEASVTDCAQVAERVKKIVDGGVSFSDIQVSVIADIDNLMLGGHFEKAQKTLAVNRFDNARIPYIDLLSLLISIGNEPIRRMSQNKADALVRSLRQLPENDDLMPIILYFLAVLSVFFYQANCIADSTKGFNALKQEASLLTTLKAKHIMMFNHVLPAKNQFSVDWKY
jgi:hypothetical protein